MRLAVFFILASTFNLAYACEDHQPCHMSAMEVFLPEAKRYPAPNIRIEKFGYQKELGNVADEISVEKITKLQKALSDISDSSFKESKTSFNVLAQLILKPSSPPEIKLHTTGEEEVHDMLNVFYKAASNFKLLKRDLLRGKAAKPLKRYDVTEMITENIHLLRKELCIN